MGKTAKGLEPTITRDRTPPRTTCPHCQRRMRADHIDRRTRSTPDGVTRLNLTIRRRNACAAIRRPHRPEAEGRVALPRHEFGLDAGTASVGPFPRSAATGSDAASPAPSGRSRTFWIGTTSCSPSRSPPTDGSGGCRPTGRG